MKPPLLLIALFILILTACAKASTPNASAETQTLTVTSSAFGEGANIPVKYSCVGENISPELKWTGAPANTKSFALLMDDPDAPSGAFTHWVAFDIPAQQTEIAAGAKEVGKQGKNGAGRNGYTSPCPPSGTHRYLIKIYALDLATLGLNEGATRAQVETAMQNHILAQGSLIGKYGK